MTDCVSKNWEPGWLMRTAHEAHIRCMAAHSPSHYRHLGPQTTPISDAEAQEVFAMLDTRFKAWTGKSLAEHVAITAGDRDES